MNKKTLSLIVGGFLVVVFLRVWYMQETTPKKPTLTTQQCAAQGTGQVPDSAGGCQCETASHQLIDGECRAPEKWETVAEVSYLPSWDNTASEEDQKWSKIVPQKGGFWPEGEYRLTFPGAGGYQKVMAVEFDAGRPVKSGHVLVYPDGSRETTAGRVPAQAGKKGFDTNYAYGQMLLRSNCQPATIPLVAGENRFTLMGSDCVVAVTANYPTSPWEVHFGPIGYGHGAQMLFEKKM